jgi:xylan 1,4-beta-xylosidase
MLRDANQKQLEVARRELGFEYIRFHGLLHDDMRIYHEENGQPFYNWARVDQLYDSFRRIGMKPFVELSFMPADLASGKKTIFWWKANITPPKDYRKWGDLIEALVRHLEDRYGATEVRSWFLEVWNEPNLSIFWTGNQADYFKLYDVTAAAVKKVDPNCRVGGPASAGGGWVREFIRHCADQNAPVDFVSTHCYAVTNFFDPDGKSVNRLSRDYNSIAADVARADSDIHNSPMPNLPLYFTEWSSSYSSRDPVHDSYLSASFILDRLKKCQGMTKAMSYWTYSDLFEEVGPPPAPFHGGFGLLNREGIRKAAFFAYKYLNELRDTELRSPDPRSWATRDAKGVSVVFWNHTLPRTNQSNQAYFIVNHPAADVAPVELSLAHLPPGGYRLEIHRTGYQSNDAYSAYIDMGRPKSLTRDELQTLQTKSSDQPETSESVEVGADGLFSRIIPLRENDVVLVSLTRL